MTQQKVGVSASASSVTATDGLQRHNSMSSAYNTKLFTAQSYHASMASDDRDVGPVVPPKPRNSIGHLPHKAPAVPFKFILRKKSKKTPKSQDVDPEALRRNLLEEAKQRRVIDQAEADKVIIMKAHAAGVFSPTSSIPGRTTSLLADHTRYSLSIRHQASDDMTLVNPNHVAGFSSIANGGESLQKRRGSALGRHKAPHRDAIVLSSEKMSPAKDGSIARLESVNINEGHPRVSSHSGVIEDINVLDESHSQTHYIHVVVEDSSSSYSNDSTASDSDDPSSFELISNPSSKTTDPTTDDSASRRSLNVPEPLTIKSRTTSIKKECSCSTSDVSASAENLSPYLATDGSGLSSVVVNEIDRQLVDLTKAMETSVQSSAHVVCGIFKKECKKTREFIDEQCENIHIKVDENYQDVSEKIDFLGSRVKRVEALTTGLAKGINSVVSSTAKQEKELTEGFASINETLVIQDQKIDTVGRVVNSCEQHLITAKEDFNEINSKVDNVKENQSALHLSYKSLQDKTDVLVEQNEACIKQTAELSSEMNFVKTGCSALQENNRTMVAGMNNIVAAVNQLNTENQKLRQDNQQLATANSQLNQTVMAVLGQFQAQQAQVTAIYNFFAALNQNATATAPPAGAMLFNQPTGSINSIVNTGNVPVMPNSPDSALHLSLQAPLAIPTIPASPAVAPAVALVSPVAPAPPSVITAAPFVPPAAATGFFSAPSWYSQLNIADSTAAQA